MKAWNKRGTKEVLEGRLEMKLKVHERLKQLKNKDEIELMHEWWLEPIEVILNLGWHAREVKLLLKWSWAMAKEINDLFELNGLVTNFLILALGL